MMVAEQVKLRNAPCENCHQYKPVASEKNTWFICPVCRQEYHLIVTFGGGKGTIWTWKLRDA